MSKKRTPKVLVTGATGFIGAGLVNGLLNAGYAVRALVLPGEETEGLWAGPVDVIEGNITDAHDGTLYSCIPLSPSSRRAQTRSRCARTSGVMCS